MYASLDRADLAIEDQDGRKLAVQTDHRSAEEIDADYDLSVIFALTRAINPQRSDQFDAVRFSFLADLNEAFAELLEQAGAEVELVEEGERGVRKPAGEIEDAVIDSVAAEALYRIGQDTLRRYGVAATAAGLSDLQTQMYAQVAASDGREEDEIGFWTAVVELGAATGEVIRTLHDGVWARDQQNMSTVPFVFGRGNSVTNVFDKVERFYERGESEAPTVLLTIMADEGEETGATMFNLRPPGWGGRDFAWCRPLLDSGELDDVPLVALVHDLPNTTRSIAKDIDDDERSTLEAEALANLAELQVAVEVVDAGGHEVLATHGDYYASEKLLDPAHLRGLQERLGAKILLAAVPRKGVLFTMSGLVSPDASAVMMAVAQGQFDDAPPNERLSPRVFLVDDGEVVGTVQIGDSEEEELSAAVDESDPNPPKTSFWARLFGG